jgi:hypothetical protein
VTDVVEARGPAASRTRGWLRTGRACAGGLSLALAWSCATPPPPGQLSPEEIETTVFLIGDAGEPDPRDVDTPLDSLRAQAATAPGRSIIVFLGDNVYPEGIPRSERAVRADARRRLAAQVRAVPEGARGIFIPGNHDWAYGGPFGLYAIRLQEELIDELAGDRDVRLLPENGCPGPAVIDAERLRLVLLDTQWWLHDYIVHDETSDCTRSTGEVTDSLRKAVAGIREDGVAVVAGHHPMMTGGEHGGYCGVSGPFHRFGGRSQDIISSSNRTMRDSLESAFAARPPLVYAAGHDHNLQVLRGTDAVRTLLVSGAGSPAKASCAVHLRESYYVAQNRAGFMRLDILRGRGVLLSVFRYERDGSGGRSYSRWIEEREGGT